MFLFIIFSLIAHANSLVSLVKGVENNHKIHMSYQQKPFVCIPYGVETISQLFLRVDVNSSCRASLSAYRKANPKESFFAQTHLELGQQYSVEGVEGLCLLHLSSENSYSEALLEDGYARIPLSMKYKDEVLDYRFKRARLRAKIKEAGMWSDAKVRNCFLIPAKE